MTFSTVPLPWRARYGVTLPGVASPRSGSKSSGETVELSCDLSGVSAQWTRQGDDQPTWTGWLPHVDSHVIQSLTRGSAEHERLQTLMQEPGRLTMQSQLLLPGQHVTLRLEADAPFTVRCKDVTHDSRPEGKRQVAEWTLSAKERPKSDQARGGREQVLPTETVPLEIELVTGGRSRGPLLDASYHADFDPYERPLRLEHLFVPWAPSLLPSTGSDDDGSSGKTIAGDPEKGRVIFFGREANCATCHRYGGEGGTVAADLTVTAHRDPAAVLRDIIEPNAAINPDYVSYAVATTSGRTLTGLFRSADDEQITLIDAGAKLHRVPRDEIEEIRASDVSLMPTGFDKLGKEQLEDLIAFLCSEDLVARREGRPTGFILREFWEDVPGNGIDSLTSRSDFPDRPTGTRLLTRFEAPTDWGEHYGTRLRGICPSSADRRIRVLGRCRRPRGTLAQR